MERTPNHANGHEFSKRKLDLEERYIELTEGLREIKRRFELDSDVGYELMNRLMLHIDGFTLSGYAPPFNKELDRVNNHPRGCDSSFENDRKGLMVMYDNDKERGTLTSALNSASTMEELEEIERIFNETEELIDKWTIVADTKEAA